MLFRHDGFRWKRIDPMHVQKGDRVILLDVQDNVLVALEAFHVEGPIQVQMDGALKFPFHAHTHQDLGKELLDSLTPAVDLAEQLASLS